MEGSMRRPVLALLLALGSLAPAACGPSSEIGARPAPRASATLLTEDEIARASYQNVFELVQALRSNWLRARGTDSLTRPTEVIVYRDDVRMGGVETLRAMATMDIGSIRFIDGISASGRWGLDHGSGVIFVVTR
jgi:hypothetical protein